MLTVLLILGLFVPTSLAASNKDYEEIVKEVEETNEEIEELIEEAVEDADEILESGKMIKRLRKKSTR